MKTLRLRSTFVLVICYLVLVNCDSDTSVISRYSKTRKSINESVVDIRQSDSDDLVVPESATKVNVETIDGLTTKGDSEVIEKTTKGVFDDVDDDDDEYDDADVVITKPSTTTMPGAATMVINREKSVIRKYKSIADNDRESSHNKHKVNIVKDALFPLLETMLIAPISDRVQAEKCRNHSKIFQRELANFKLWAIQMMDASSNFPSGVLSGSVYQLGHFDECLRVDVELPGQQSHLRGQYCLAEIEFGPNNFAQNLDLASAWAPTDFNTSAWIKLKGSHNDRRLRRRDVLHWAVCIPDSCSAADLQLSMDQALQEFGNTLDINIGVRVQDSLCQTDTGFFSKLTAGDYVMAAVILACVLMVGAGTLNDLVRSKTHSSREGSMGKFLQCFSGKQSLKNWVRVDANKDMIPVHFVRFGCMIGILMGHHFIADANSPLLNSEFLEMASNNLLAQPILVIPALVVDSFFLVSGFLTARFILLDLDRKKLKVFAGYMHRFLRLTPVYMLMVGFHATLLGKIGSGPLWPTRLARDQYRCSKNWWTNLLYINNYVNTEELCLFQSWHVACDLHFSLIAPILVLCLWHRPRTGLSLIAFLGAAITTALFAITWIWDLDPILMSFINIMTDLSADPTFRLQYIPTHTRGVPYLFGILAAYIHFKYPYAKKQLSQRMVLFSWVVTVALMTSPMFGAIIFYSPNSNPASWMAPTYAALHRIPWSLGQAWVIVVGITGNAGFLQKILDFKLIVPLSRLSYCVFLVHNAVQLYVGASVRSPQYVGVVTILWSLLGDIVVTYSIALVAHMLFEAPVQRLDKTFFTKADNKNKQSPAVPSTTNGAVANGNGWKQNLAYEKGSDEIATIYKGTDVPTNLSTS